MHWTRAQFITTMFIIFALTQTLYPCARNQKEVLGRYATDSHHISTVEGMMNNPA